MVSDILKTFRNFILIMNSVKVNIDLSFEQIVSAAKQLSAVQKNELNTFLWDDDSVIPKEHKTLVRERIKKSRLNPNVMLDWEEAIKTLKS